MFVVIIDFYSLGKKIWRFLLDNICGVCIELKKLNSNQQERKERKKSRKQRKKKNELEVSVIDSFFNR
jgi:hypothetical protein